MKKYSQDIWYIFVDSAIAFTVVSLLYVPVAKLDLSRFPGINAPQPLSLFFVCLVLSATQTVCSHIPALEKRGVVRALINMLELFLLGGLLFKWFSFGFWPLLAAGGASCIAFGAIWVIIDIKNRRDAEDINEAIQKQKKNHPMEKE